MITALVVAVLVSASHASDVVTVFVDETEFSHACKDMSSVQLNFDDSFVNQAAEAHPKALGEGTRLGSTLNFMASVSNMPVNIRMVKQERTSDFHFRKIVSADGTAHSAVQAAPGTPAFQVIMDSSVHDIAVDYSMVYALGITIEGSSTMTSKSLNIFTPGVMR